MKILTARQMREAGSHGTFFVPWVFVLYWWLRSDSTAAVSRVKRPLLSGRIFYVTVNLRKNVQSMTAVGGLGRRLTFG